MEEGEYSSCQNPVSASFSPQPEPSLPETKTGVSPRPPAVLFVKCKVRAARIVTVLEDGIGSSSDLAIRCAEWGCYKDMWMRLTESLDQLVRLMMSSL